MSVTTSSGVAPAQPGCVQEAHDVDVFIGRQIKFARISRNMSQEKLGDRLGLTFQQIQKYERGTNRVSGGRLFQIAVIMQKPVEWFFPDEQIALDPGPDVVQQMLCMPYGLDVARAFPRLGPKDCATIAELTQRLATPAEAPIAPVNGAAPSGRRGARQHA